MAGMKIRKGDTVEVLTGKDRGKRGQVLESQPERGRVIVEHRNIAKKHARPRPVKGTRGAQMTPGGVIDIEAPLRIDNVGLVCPACDEVTIVGFKFREGMPIGCKVTLRGARMYDFLDRLVTIALPRIRDFRGIDPSSFDGRGNFSLGVREQIIF